MTLLKAFLATSMLLLPPLTSCSSRHLPHDLAGLSNTPSSAVYSSVHENKIFHSKDINALKKYLTRSARNECHVLRVMPLTENFLKLEIKEALKKEALQYGLDDDQLKYSIKQNLETKLAQGFCLRIEIDTLFKCPTLQTRLQSSAPIDEPWNLEIAHTSRELTQNTLVWIKKVEIPQRKLTFQQGELCSKERPVDIKGLSLKVRASPQPTTSIAELVWR